ncbi:hypothetical protein GIB67_034253, partial [Kingdonia uniflora]
MNIPIVGGNFEGEGATSNDDVGPSDKSLMRSFRFHIARSIALEHEKLPIRVHHHQSTWDLTKEPQVDLNAFKSLKVGGTGNSLSLRKLKEHYAYKLEKVLSDGTATAAKKKKGLTVRSVAHAYMLHILGSFLFLTKNETNVSARYLYLFAKDKVAKKWSWESVVLAHMYYNMGTTSRDDGRQFACYTTLLEWKEFVLKKADRGWRVREGPLVCIKAYLEWFTSISWATICPITVDLATNDDVGIHQRKEASVNEHGDTPVHQYKDIAEQYDASHHEHASLSPNAHGTMQTRGRSDGFDQQITTLNDQLQKLKEDKVKDYEANINLREALKEKTSECDMLKETIGKMNEEIELKRLVDEQCVL